MDIYLKCFLMQNLGDDLFLKIITDRYSNNFLAISTVECSKKYNIGNLKVIYINDFIFRIFNKLSKFVRSNNLLEKYYINKCGFVVEIAGSIFIESKELKNRKILLSEWYDRLNKPYYIVGANIGPYYTEKFLEDVNSILAKAEDVCLRDKKSRELCCSKNIRQASDIIFSLDVSDYVTNKENKEVVFSLIDCDRKSTQIPNPNILQYENKMIEMIRFFQKKNYKIRLMSFCKFDGDENAIDKIFSKLDDKTNVSKYCYEGNIDEALTILGEAEIIVGSRFHANVVGLLMNKTIIPIIYNDKTRNLLNDLNFKGKILDINNIDNFDVNSITDEDLNYKLDVSFQRKDAERHFEKLDQVLEKRK